MGVEVEYLNGEESSHVEVRSMPLHSAIGIGSLMVQGWLREEPYED